MTFDEVLMQVQELLQRKKRVSYRGLKRRFDLDDEYLEDLKEELIGAKRLAADEDGRFLVWTGGTAKAETGTQLFEAEVHWLKGELTLKQSAVGSPQSSGPHTLHPTPYTPAETEAEACFHKAIAIARKQQAKSLELRATTSLARLWQQGKKDEARHMLAEIYGWFTEGFETKDLQEAKALLEELAG